MIEPRETGEGMVRFVWWCAKVGLTLAALGAVVGVAFLLTLRFATTAKSVEVPRLVGLDPPSAVRKLNQVGLGIQFEEEERSAYDEHVPAGHILRQSPAPGSFLKQERKVRVTLSLGARDLYVPRVLGEPVTAAQMRLQEAGLKVGEVVYVPSRLVPENAVIDQEPSRLGASPDAAVSLLVSSGAQAPQYVMPDLIGKAALRARAFLELKGYRVKVESEVYEGVPEGRVIRQKPLAGHPVRVGDTAWLWVSRSARSED